MFYVRGDEEKLWDTICLHHTAEMAEETDMHGEVGN